MKNTQELLNEARSQGWQIQPHAADKLVVYHAGDTTIPPDFVSELREHKVEMLAWLSVQHLVKQIYLGEFDGPYAGPDVAKIARTLRASGHPLGRRALERLFAGEPRTKKIERAKHHAD
jgi:hypothetical protein